MLEVNRIYNGDALDEMGKIDSGSVDLVVTDPPYALGCSSNAIKPTAADYSVIKPFFQKLQEEIARVLKPEGCAYIFTDWRTYPFLYQVMPTELAVKNLLVWDKKHIGTGSFYRYRHEFIMFCVKDKYKRIFSPCESDIFSFSKTDVFKDGKRHPTQKAVALLEKFVSEGSAEGGLVLDPFMGSGSTAIACLNLKRNFLGFELDEKYHRAAEARIEKWHVESVLSS